MGEWNVRTLNGSARRELFADVLTHRGIEICALCETKCREEETMSTLRSSTGQGYVLYSTAAKDGVGGVGIALRETLAESVVWWRPGDARTCAIRLRCRPLDLVLVVAYAPTEQSEEKEKDGFYETLSETYQATRGDLVIVAGDFNARL